MPKASYRPPIEKSTGEICRPGKILWWTTDCTADPPSGPRECADVLPDCVDSSCASSHNPSEFALRTVKTSWRSWTAVDGQVGVVSSYRISQRFYNSTSKANTPNLHGAACWIRTETSGTKWSSAPTVEQEQRQHEQSQSEPTSKTFLSMLYLHVLCHFFGV